MRKPKKWIAGTARKEASPGHNAALSPGGGDFRIELLTILAVDEILHERNHMAISVLFPYSDSVPESWGCNRKTLSKTLCFYIEKRNDCTPKQIFIREFA